MYGVAIITQGTQKSIDKARELIDEVLSRPDKEYEAAKHQLGHSGHFPQQNRSYEVQSTKHCMAQKFDWGNFDTFEKWLAICHQLTIYFLVSYNHLVKISRIKSMIGLFIKIMLSQSFAPYSNKYVTNVCCDFDSFFR